MEINGRVVKGKIDLDGKGIVLNCPWCGIGIIVKEAWLLSDEAIETDCINEVYLGGAFFVCPVCNTNKYVSSKYLRRL